MLQVLDNCIHESKQLESKCSAAARTSGRGVSIGGTVTAGAREAIRTLQHNINQLNEQFRELYTTYEKRMRSIEEFEASQFEINRQLQQVLNQKREVEKQRETLESNLRDLTQNSVEMKSTTQIQMERQFAFQEELLEKERIIQEQARVIKELKSERHKQLISEREVESLQKRNMEELQQRVKDLEQTVEKFETLLKQNTASAEKKLTEMKQGFIDKIRILLESLDEDIAVPSELDGAFELLNQKVSNLNMKIQVRNNHSDEDDIESSLAAMQARPLMLC